MNSRLQGTLSRFSRAELHSNRESLTDEQLLQQFASLRDAVSFEVLVNRHGPMVLGVCRRVLGNRHDAEDAFQATFLVLVRKAGTLREGGVLANWLYGVAHRTALNARAGIRHRQAFERPVEDVPDRTAGASDNFDLVALLDSELSRLPDRYRLSVVLCDLQGLTRVEAARRLGCPEGTLSTWLLRARDLLAQRLTRRGGALSAAALTLVVEQSARASVGRPLLDATVRTVTGGAIPVAAPHVDLLASHVVRSMLIAKLRTAAVLVVTVGALAGAGAAWFGASGPDGTARARDDRPATLPPTNKSAPVVPKERAQFKHAARAALSADGTVLVTTDASGQTITFRDLARDRELGKLTVKVGDVRVLALSPDGKLLATGGDEDIVRLWDVPRREQLAVFKEKVAPDAIVLSLAFSPDGKTLAAGNELETIKLFDLVTKKQSGTLAFKGSDVCALAFSPDGKTLAAGGEDNGAHGGRVQDGLILLFSVADRKEVGRLVGHTSYVKALAFSRDGKTLVTGACDSMVLLWDFDQRKLRTTLKGHTNEVKCVGITPDGKTIISGSRDRTTRLWDAATGKEVIEPLTHNGSVNTISLSANGTRFVTSDTEGKARVWDLLPGGAPAIGPRGDR